MNNYGTSQCYNGWMKKDNLIKRAIKIKYPLVVAILLIGGLGYGFYRYGIVATVDGRPIDRLSYWVQLEKQDNKQVLESMVQENMIRGEAAKKGLVVDQELINAEIKQIENRLSEGNQKLDEALEARGMTRGQLEEQIRIQKMVELLAKPATEVDEKEIEEFVEKNKSQFPKGTSKDEMKKMAEEELLAQARQEAIGVWFEELKKETKVVYR